MKSFNVKECKKFLTSMLSIMLTIALLVSAPYLYAFTINEYEVDSQYEETHDQINFDDLSVFIYNKDNISVEVDPSTSIFKKAQANNEKKSLRFTQANAQKLLKN